MCQFAASTDDDFLFPLVLGVDDVELLTPPFLFNLQTYFFLSPFLFLYPVCIYLLLSRFPQTPSNFLLFVLLRFYFSNIFTHFSLYFSLLYSSTHLQLHPFLSLCFLLLVFIFITIFPDFCQLSFFFLFFVYSFFTLFLVYFLLSIFISLYYPDSNQPFFPFFSFSFHFVPTYPFYLPLFTFPLTYYSVQLFLFLHLFLFTCSYSLLLSLYDSRFHIPFPSSALHIHHFNLIFFTVSLYSNHKISLLLSFFLSFWSLFSSASFQTQAYIFFRFYFTLFYSFVPIRIAFHLFPFLYSLFTFFIHCRFSLTYLIFSFLLIIASLFFVFFLFTPHYHSVCAFRFRFTFSLLSDLAKNFCLV